MKQKPRALASQEVKQTVRVDAKLVTASRLLELPRFELDEVVLQELSENPALELLDGGEDFGIETSCKHFERLKSTKGRRDEGSEVDWVDFLVAPVVLRDHLEAQFLPRVSPEDRGLALFLIDCVNPKGYLDLSPEEIANLTGTDLDKVKDLIRLLQECDPAGVGATDLRECLLLQLKRCEDAESHLAYEIIEEHWQLLIQHRHKALAKALRKPLKVVKEAVRRISSLTPYPGEAFVAEHQVYVPAGSVPVVPDLVFQRDASGVRVSVVGWDESHLTINHGYLAMFRRLGRSSHVSSEEEAVHVKTFVFRALNFLEGLHHRKIVLLRIGQELLRVQGGYILTGSVKFLKPLTRVQLARAVGLHESTVSRATMNKHVQLATGEVVPFDIFFKPSLRVRLLIEEILSTENPHHPLSDREIAETLRAQGINIARRTVAKYREQIRILSSHRRKTA
ncbi:MAG: RNA polymerase factor sigma-54 [Candidatus Caldarchaeum sp.]